jgi:hypothetical protein
MYVQVVRRNRDGSNERIAAAATGFIITKEGHLLTAAHVIPADDPNTEARLFASTGPRDSQRFELFPIKLERDLDIALLQLPPSREWKALTIVSSSTVPDEAALLVLGFPKGQDLSSGPGHVRNKFARGGRFQTTLPLNYGDSGSPVFDISGRVIGMAQGGIDEANLITFVVPSDFFRPLTSLVLQPLSPGDTPSRPVKRSFPFSFTVESDEKRELEQISCLPEGVRASRLDSTVASINGEGTRIISALPMQDRPNCIVLRVFVAGKGVDRIGGVVINHRGRGWLSGQLNVYSD